MNPPVLTSSKSKKSSKESFVKSAPVTNTTGLKTNTLFSVVLVGSERVLRAAQSWNESTYRSEHG